MGLVAKLQEDYLKKELEIKKLNRIIVALEFRYLLEKLPDLASPGDGAGDRWMNSWERVLQNEADDHLKPVNRPNKHLMEFMESYNPGRVDAERVSSTRTTRKVISSVRVRTCIAISVAKSTAIGARGMKSETTWHL